MPRPKQQRARVSILVRFDADEMDAIDAMRWDGESRATWIKEASLNVARRGTVDMDRPARAPVATPPGRPKAVRVAPADRPAPADLAAAVGVQTGGQLFADPAPATPMAGDHEKLMEARSIMDGVQFGPNRGARPKSVAKLPGRR